MDESRLPGGLLLFRLQLPPCTLPGLRPYLLTATTTSPASPLSSVLKSIHAEAAAAEAPTPSRKPLQPSPDRGNRTSEQSLAHYCLVQCKDEVRVG